MNVEGLIQNGWIAIWELAARYHRYQVENIEVLDEQPALIVGYHGRSLAADLCILSVKLHERLGYLPHCFVHRSLLDIPGWDNVIRALGFLTHDDEEITKAVQRREHILVPPGGAFEGMRAYTDNYTVNWPSAGYVRLAIRHKLPIVPVAAAGADETYIGLMNGEEIVERLGLSRNLAWAPWTGIGLLGLYPLSPPFPVRLYQVIGQPISTGDVEENDKEGVSELHDLVKGKVQSLLEYAREAKETL